MNTVNASPSHRYGGTSYQVLTFLLVAALGVWLAAEYLGVNVEHLAHTALAEAKVIDRIPEKWRPAAPLPELGDAEGQIPFEERAAELLDELHGLRNEVAAIRQNVKEEASSQQRSAPASFTHSPAIRRQATLAYWTRLRQIAAEVNELHNGVEVALTSDSATVVFDIRSRAFDYGCRAIDSIDANEVDRQAVDVGFRIAKWYRSGADLYTRANDVWQGRAEQENSADVQKKLEAAKQHHAREAELVRELTSRTEEILMRRYAVEFPVVNL
ncbi:MAG: hypothetical protein KDA37_16115 [Planctomycetales bacterium]|nr:hypothetical protein [Planctomycetales bacterium]